MNCTSSFLDLGNIHSILGQRVMISLDYFKEHFPNFSPEEFRCPCTNPDCKKDGIELPFLRQLQKARSIVGFPFLITSGYRCKAYNKTLPDSSPESLHIKGLACDVRISHLTPADKYLFLYKVFPLFKGIGLGKTFVHLDGRQERSVWMY